MTTNLDSSSQLAVFPEIKKQKTGLLGKTGNNFFLQFNGNQYTFSGKLAKDKTSHVTRIVDPVVLQKSEDTFPIQIHSSNKDFLYFSISDGIKNPSYVLLRLDDKNKWTVTPVNDSVDKQAFVEGIVKEANAILNAIDDFVVKPTANLAGHGVNLSYHAAMLPGQGNLFTNVLIGAGLGGLYDFGRRSMFNTKEENDKEDTLQRVARYLLPAIAYPMIGGIQQGAAPDYYKDSWNYKLVGNVPYKRLY